MRPVSKGFSKILRINVDDLNEYFYTMKIKSKIRLFYKDISRTMPFKLKEEFRTKYRGIKLVDTNKRVFQYYVKQPSNELKSAVEQFKIIVSP